MGIREMDESQEWIKKTGEICVGNVKGGDGRY